MERVARLSLLFPFLALVGCGEQQVECVPASVSEVSAQNAQLSISRQLSEAGREAAPITAKNPQVHIYLDVSNSMRGFLSGGTCGQCVSPDFDPKPENRFEDPLFSTLVNQLTSLPLQSLPTAKTSYHVFAEKVADVSLEDLTTISKIDQCYDYNTPSVRKIIDDRTYSKFRKDADCIFDRIGLVGKQKTLNVGSRDRSPFKAIFDDVYAKLTSEKDKIDEGLFVIASDLFFSETQEVVGVNSAVVAPLAKLVSSGFQVRLFGYRAPFVGWVTDVPGSPFQVKGLAPFYYLAIGTPGAIDRFSRTVQLASLTMQHRSSATTLAPLAGSGRFEVFGIGGRGLSASSSFSFDAAFPSDGGLGQAIISNEVDANRVLPASGMSTGDAAVTVTWQRRASGDKRPALTANGYRATILGWRWNGQAADGASCPVSWELIPTSTLNATPLKAVGPDSLSLTLFQGSGLSLQPKTPYVIQMELQKIDQSGPDWVQSWSSDAGIVNDDRIAAQKGMSVLRTYNLALLFRSLAAAAPLVRPTVQAPLGNGVLAVRFD